MAFLTAQWRHLALLNYEVDPALLSDLVPQGTELDHWNGKTFLSLVGFRFLDTKVRGIPVPFHCNFTEVNLRFYVRRREGEELRRGVVFVKEIVPRAAIAIVARHFYNEKYVSLPMRHRIETRESCLSVRYGWYSGAGWKQLSLTAEGNPATPSEDSEEFFITEHYWGYTSERDGGTVEYRVDHPSWRVWRNCSAVFDGDVTDLYGKELAAVVTSVPSSALLAEGSAVTVFAGRPI